MRLPVALKIFFSRMIVVLVGGEKSIMVLHKIDWVMFKNIKYYNI